ncbi:MAG: serine/threonine protein kinase, partial [Chloroflexi bacterium]|nr:serine/threonine protein kinase [Chloroflexota bacterium]
MSIKRNSQLEHLILLEKLGTGGQGEVWSAYDQDKDRVVAAKLLPESPEHRSDVSQELDKEFYLLASISHPHILPLFELYLTAEWQYYTMHYCPAGSLRDWLRTAEPTWDAVIAMAAQIASALDYLHDLHIVHRDLKPSNILRDMDDCLFLTDFGLATMIGRAQTDVVHTGRGTIPYAPPEQQTGDTVTPRSDIFSLGIVLYEMITGHLPGDREYSLGHAQSVDRSTTLPAPQESRLPMPQPVLRALRKLTAADPADRPESAVDAFAEVLAALSTAGQIDDLEDRLEALEPVLVADTTPAATSLQRRDAQALLGTADIGLTDYALLNAGLDAPGLTVEQKAYMLHGAFVHNYRIDYWRYMMEAHPAERFAVYSHLLVDYDNDATARRVVEQLAAENPDTLLAHSLTPAAVGKLIGWATQGTGTLAGAVAFDVLETMVNREAASWEDDILPEEGLSLIH